MSTNTTNVPSVEPPTPHARPALHHVTVARSEMLTPHLRRIVFADTNLGGFGAPLPGAHIKLFFSPIREIGICNPAGPGQSAEPTPRVQSTQPKAPTKEAKHDHPRLYD